MTGQRFGSSHTPRKLAVVDNYLRFYTRVLSSKFRLLYVDAFAGTGEILLFENATMALPGIVPDQEEIEGSAFRALGVEPSFDGYIFVEKSRKKIQLLEQQVAERFPAKIDRCRFMQQDANRALKKLCEQTDWKLSRGAVFLDPFGCQIDWPTLELIAATKAIDLWYLFPSGLGVYRQIPGSKKPLDDHSGAIIRMLGTDEWLGEFTKTTTETDLLGERIERVEKIVDVPQITAYVIRRLRTIFGDGVLSESLLLGGKNVPKYSLIFACANPEPSARDLAHKVARWIVERA